MLKLRRKTALQRNNGYIGTVIVFILIAAVAVYYLKGSKEQNLEMDIGSDDYIDQNVFSLNTMDILATEELNLANGESKTVINKGYSLKITRGKDYDVEEGNKYSPYLFEVLSEKTPLKAYEYFIVGIPLGENMKKFYIVSYREKRAR